MPTHANNTELVQLLLSASLACTTTEALAQRWVSESIEEKVFKSEEELMASWGKKKCQIQLESGWTTCGVDKLWTADHLWPDNTKYGEAVVTSCLFGECYTFKFGLTLKYIYIVERFESTSDSPGACSAYGNPIAPRTASKKTIVKIPGLPGLPLTLMHSSERNGIPTADRPLPSEFSHGSFGPYWTSSVDKSLSIQKARIKTGIQAKRGDTRQLSFVSDSSGGFKTSSYSRDRLILESGEFLYFASDARQIEVYDNTGKLLRIADIQGASFTFKYTEPNTQNGRLDGISDSYGRELRFERNEQGLIHTIRQTDSIATQVAYLNQNLPQEIIWADENRRTLQYDVSGFPDSLSAILDENGKLHSSYQYDLQGRAWSTQLSGGANRYEASWTTPPRWSVSESYDRNQEVIYRDYRWIGAQGTRIQTPSGGFLNLEFADISGSPHLVSQSQPAGAGCSASSKSLGYDSQGNISREVNFNGSQTCYAHDPNRKLETSRISGLASTADCTAIQAAAALPVGAVKVSTQWHPVWPIQTKLASPNLLDTWVFNGQADPFDSNKPASCAPAGAKLPDGKPIVVLCKRVEQATTDVNGSKGFAASLQDGVPARVWSYTYNEFGQVLTEKDPLNNLTTRAYYSDTTASYTKGDLQSITNALGQITRFTEYNPMGQVLKMVDANEVSTEYRYDLRQRLTDVIVNGVSINRYEYWPTGLLKRAVQADDSFVAYEYDDAHRLTAVADAKGNRIEYTLDNAGQRTAEKVKDPGGSLARQLTRVHDALGRVQQLTGRN